MSELKANGLLQNYTTQQIEGWTRLGWAGVRCSANNVPWSSVEDSVALYIHSLCIHNSWTGLGWTGLGWTGLGCSANNVPWSSVEESIALYIHSLYIYNSWIDTGFFLNNIKLFIKLIYIFLDTTARNLG